MNKLQKEHITALRGQGESYNKIAAALGISVNTIQSYCRRNKIESKPTTTADIEINIESHFFCKQCGSVLIQQPSRKKKLFCSEVCCDAWWKANPDKLGKKAMYSFKCEYCGAGFTAYGNKGRKYCSHACYISSRFGKAAVS